MIYKVIVLFQRNEECGIHFRDDVLYYIFLSVLG